MSYTLLKMVQLILSSMDSDEVSGITDTVESQQVVDIIESTFNDLCSTVGFPEEWDFFQLIAPQSPLVPTDLPTMLIIPDNIMKFDWLQYDNSTDTSRRMVAVSPLVRGEFMNRMNAYDTNATNVYSYSYTNSDSQVFNIRGRKDTFPTYYTVLRDKTVIFDSYDADVDATKLDPTKTLGWGKKALTFTRSDSFIPPLSEQNFSLLFNEAKAQCFIDLKQVPNAKADQRARQAKISSQTSKERSPREPAMYNTPNYGRRTGRTRILG